MAPFGFTPKARHNRGVALRSTYRLDGWVMGPVDKEGWGLSYVFAQPSVLAAAATDLAGIGSAINQATAAVAAPTTGLAAAAADEVSTALATLFGAYGQQFQAISAQVAAFHNEFTQRLAAAANAFVNAEATNTSALVQEATAGLFKPTSPRCYRQCSTKIRRSSWAAPGHRYPRRVMSTPSRPCSSTPSSRIRSSKRW